MTWINGAARTLLPALAIFAMLFVATALTLPQPAQAQQNCLGCIYAGEEDGLPGAGIGQPGVGFDCGDQPDGMTDCNFGRYRDFNYEWVEWCETGGSMCQALMFLDFSEDGAASWAHISDPTRSHPQGDQRTDSTCDGVLLRSEVLEDTPHPSNATLAFAL